MLESRVAAEGREFSPALFLIQGAGPPATTPVLLILNQPITDFDTFSRLWSRSGYRICADGGANRLYDIFEGELKSRRGNYVPSAVHGDLDSLRDNVRLYYESLGVEVTQDHDQYSTDFAKAMNKVSSIHTNSSLRDIILLGTLGGRVDQGLGLLHEMIREETRDPLLRLWLFSESSVSFILRGNCNIIRALISSQCFTRNVGLVPIYGPAIISTSGLEWDVKDWDTQMGHQVSTSNHVVADNVEVKTSAPILFTVERVPTIA
ncbi:thiamine pyrophosphokinase-like protein 1 [Polyplosphaeria fusca]|uniref:Thiamine pyrophosphokinase n=1 Tax=Polyplosphaeria fusca TaxID=682080 RepID=A0A9P4QW24_9PLEO|nr:thiamine pyrophosphokinase-like protein 1 [Polyplosphaeria fusca]